MNMELTVNGEARSAQVDAGTRLIDLLRDEFSLRPLDF